jgi:chromosome segregation ATPase
MDVKARIEQAKARIEKAKRAQAVAETQLQAAEQQKQEVTAKMAEMGVTPETAADEIAKLEAKIAADLDKVEALIPAV